MELSGEGWTPPDAVRDEVDFHWFHIKPGCSLVLLLVGDRPIWYVGHFVGGRMRPCDGVECRECAEGIGRQIRYVFQVVEPGSRRGGCIEVSKSVALQVQDWVAHRGQMAGTMIEFEHVSKSKHSRMELHLVAREPPPWVWTVPQYDLLDVLRRTFSRADVVRSLP